MKIGFRLPNTYHLLSLAFVGFCLLGFAMRGGKSRSRIEVEKSIMDFGLVKPGEYKTMSLRFSNQGETDLYLSEVLTSCNCSGAEIVDSRLGPGEESEILVSVKGGLQPKSSASLLVLSNDRNNPRIKVGISFRSRVGIWAQKSLVSFGAVNGETATRREVRIQGDSRVAATDLSVSSNDAFRQSFDYELLDDASSEDAIADVWIRRDAPKGFIDGRLLFERADGSSATANVTGYNESQFVSLIRPICIDSPADGFTCKGMGFIVLSPLAAENCPVVNVSASSDALSFETKVESERIYFHVMSSLDRSKVLQKSGANLMVDFGGEETVRVPLSFAWDAGD